jgi:hypothetical protein
METPPRFHLTHLDVAILMFHVQKGARHPEVGFEDSERTLKELTDLVTKKRRVTVQQGPLESALWSANLLDEAGSFWHPEGLTFRDWVRTILRSGTVQGAHFDRVYNRILKDEEITDEALDKAR